MSHRLVIVAGPDEGKSFPVTGPAPLVIGRGSDTAIRLADPHASRVHCEVTVEGNDIVIADRGSVAGTLVNGTRVGRQVLRPGDVLQVGSTQLRLEAEDFADQQTLAPPVERPRLRPPPQPRPIAAALPPPVAVPVRPASGPAPLPAERLHELSGTRISHYQLGPVLAKGQSGLLFRAHDDKHNREAAVKVLWPKLAQDDEEVQRFVRTMRTILPLRHPNLVALFGAGRTGPYCWLALEYVEGQSAAQVIARTTAGLLSFDWKPALRVLRDVGRALAFAHGHQIIHRDVAPQNILFCEQDGAAKLGGLVLAKALEGKLAEQLTQPGEVLGDLRYMSPERTTGGLQASDARSDLYSLGATVYALLTGRPPLQGASFVDTVLKIRKEQPLPPRHLQPAVPAALEAVVLRLLAKRPEDRFQTAEDLLTDLGPLLKPRRGP